MALPTNFKSFYAEILGKDEALEIDAINTIHKKAIRIIPSKYDIDKLKKLIAKHFSEADMLFDVFSDDAIITKNEELLQYLSHSSEFASGKFYIQALPAYLVIKYLPIGNAEYAFDACAAPGGKGLHCYDRFLRKKPVIMNDLSKARRKKMLPILKTYQASELPILGIDAARICRFVTNEIPLIILDVPCSGESHILEDSRRLKNWSPKQS